MGTEPKLAQALLERIDRLVTQEINLMEVCGTHTMAISSSGIRRMVPHGLKLLSGPGCPVCVTPVEDIDWLIELTRYPDVILATFGDMMKVPGSSSCLEAERAQGAKIKVVYSPLDALQIAQDNPAKKVCFVGVGFETTSPTVASTVLLARRKGVENLHIYAGFKLIPPAMGFLSEKKQARIDGFICPGHVSTIIGSHPYEFIPQRFGIPCVITGFEPLDILQGIWMLLRQKAEANPRVEIQYSRGVTQEGNPKALASIEMVFARCDSQWRGIGQIPSSGLGLKEEFSRYNAKEAFDLQPPSSEEPKGCICGPIMMGLKVPAECGLFGGRCTPQTPVGPCMVSSEGACAAYYKYGEN